MQFLNYLKNISTHRLRFDSKLNSHICALNIQSIALVLLVVKQYPLMAMLDLE